MRNHFGIVVLAFIILLLSSSNLTAETVSAYVGDIGCASDSQKGFNLAKSIAQIVQQSGIVSKIFVKGDSLLDVYFNAKGGRLIQVDPAGAKVLLRSWVKLMSKYYGTSAINVTLHENDGTPVGEGTKSIFSGKIKAEIF